MFSSNDRAIIESGPHKLKVSQKKEKKKRKIKIMKVDGRPV